MDILDDMGVSKLSAKVFFLFFLSEASPTEQDRGDSVKKPKLHQVTE